MQVLVLLTLINTSVGPNFRINPYAVASLTNHGKGCAIVINSEENATIVKESCEQVESKIHAATKYNKD